MGYGEVGRAVTENSVLWEKPLTGKKLEEVRVGSVISSRSERRLREVLSLKFVVPGRLFGAERGDEVVVCVFAPMRFLLSVGYCLSRDCLVFKVKVKAYITYIT